MERGDHCVLWQRALARARLNELYPDPVALGRYYAAFAEDVGAWRFDAESGAPPYTAWVRCRSARLAAGEQAMAPLDALRVDLRYARDGKQGFRVVLDKCGMSGTWSRTALELEQGEASRRWVFAERLAAQATPALRALVYRQAELDAELTFSALSSEPGLLVQRVTRGTVGPAFAGPEALHERFGMAWEAGDWVAGFGLEQVDRELAEDRANDPLRKRFVERLSPEARAQYEQARTRHGYRVHRDRKWVVTPGARPRILGYVHHAGMRNLVHALEAT